MTTAELIDRLRALDPSGECGVALVTVDAEYATETWEHVKAKKDPAYSIVRIEPDYDSPGSPGI